MSKLNQAIHEIQTLEDMANENRWVNQIHPLVKLFITVFYIVNVVSFQKYDLMGLFGMFVYPFVLFQIGEVSFLDALRRLRIVLPMVCIVGIFNPFFDRNPAAVVCGITLSGGVLSMLTLMLKGIFAVLASYLLIAATTIEKICYALRLLHIPKLFVTQILLIYRYITVLLTETKRITDAYVLRAPGEKGIRLKAWGPLVGQLLLRSIDRAEEVYESMCLRGYQGEFYYGEKQKFSGKDWVFLFVWFVVIGGFRCFPVFQMVGNLFVK